MDVLGRIETMMCVIVSKVLLEPSAQCAEMLMAVTVALVIVAVKAVVVREDYASRDLEARRVLGWTAFFCYSSFFVGVQLKLETVFGIGLLCYGVRRIIYRLWLRRLGSSTVLDK